MPPTLFPDPSRLRLDLLRVDGATITVRMATTPVSSACPLCGSASARSTTEATARAFWLLEERITLEQRIARCLVERLNDARQEYLVPKDHSRLDQRIANARMSSRSYSKRLCQQCFGIGFTVRAEWGTEGYDSTRRQASAKTEDFRT